MKTYGDLLTALILHYEKCIADLPKDIRSDYLRANDVNDGICKCINHKFNKPVSSKFIRSFTKGKFYLCNTPIFEPYEDAKHYLQLRADRMKELRPEWENVDL